MDRDLRHFFMQWLGVVASTLFFVAFIAFFSMPLALGYHPGEANDRLGWINTHMT